MTFKIDSTKVVAEDFGSEIVILNMENGKYYSAHGNASALWRDVTSGYPIPKILESIQGQIDTKLIDAFIKELVDEGLVIPTDSPTNSSKTSEFIEALKSSTEFSPLQSFDDMSELILSDPIHDVAEDIGWPVKKN